ncbi:MAG TPA: DUF4258 domain-containing protein [Polyangiaceae bacterium]|nr:DUF4258 domain-containing protein [Polyangiaceae bacterium]
MSPAEALAEIRRAAIARRVRFSPHARQRMNQRFVRPPDVYCALESATACMATEQERWKVAGPDRDGDELTMVVKIEGDVVVITVF